MSFSRKSLYSFFKKLNLFIVFLCLVCVYLFILIVSPTFSLKNGNLFFGNVPVLYNVTLAQFFFINASYPLLKITPPPFAHYQLSRTYFITGNLEQALHEIKNEITLYPDEKRSYYILGLTLGYMHREQEAIDAFSKFVEKYPESWAARNDKAWLQFRIGDIDGALETVEPVVASYEKNVWVQNTYCALLINKKNYVKAKRACEYAKEAIDKMTEEDWGQAYPGNDPRIYNTGLEAMKKSIESNLRLIENSGKI